MRLVWSPLALDRVTEIAEYIALDNSIAAQRWVDKLFSKVERLSEFPHRGRMVPEIDNKAFRELIFGNYRVIYRVEKDQVSILTVRHGRQLLPLEEVVAR